MSETEELQILYPEVTEELLEEIKISRSDLQSRYDKYPRELPKRTHVRLGYKLKEGDPSLQVFDPVSLLLLDFALDMLDSGSSYRSSIDFINSRVEKYTSIDRKISHAGLKKLREEYRPNHIPKDKFSPFLIKKKLTREERFRAIRKEKIARTKASITRAEKRIKKIREELDPVLERNKEIEEELKKNTNLIQFTEYDESEIQDIDESLVVFKPNPGPQSAFLAATETQVLFGGAAGGGKSYALLADPMRFFHNKNFSGLIVRKSIDELRELKWKSRELYPKAFPGAKFQEVSSSWRFPSGAILWMSYLERDEDVLRYQGLSFTWIGFDELTHWSSPFAWDYLFSRLRSTDPELARNLSMRATSNPGGPGHGWVKRMFIDPSPPGHAFDAQDIETGVTLVYPEGHPLAGDPLFKRRFIPAKVSDNPYLWDDGIYERNLLALPEDRRRQLLEGDWGVADGAAFSEFRTSIHTCEPFNIPSHWKRFRSCDWGYSSRQQTAIHWFAIAPDDTLYVYREKIVNQMTAREVAQMILKIEREADERIAYGVLDASAWAQKGQTAPSIAEEMIKVGCRWRPSDRMKDSRKHGANRMHEVLRIRTIFDGENTIQRPGIIFFNTCRKIISTLPVIPQDPDGTDDIDDNFTDDHAYDSVRYGVMSRPKFADPWVNKKNNTPHKVYRPIDPIFGY